MHPLFLPHIQQPAVLSQDASRTHPQYTRARASPSKEIIPDSEPSTWEGSARAECVWNSRGHWLICLDPAFSTTGREASKRPLFETAF